MAGLPSSILVNNNPGACGQTVSWTQPTAADNCPGSTIANRWSSKCISIGTTSQSTYATDATTSSSNFAASFLP
jgi:hypothetical protein